ncbi:interleukin-22 receptor subunit alpha-2 [Megalops cyprinoides]|uniref:interleukin-22 receptor subunit alpha-2 n=1 Tax=Megalops cyprinoides TaxID=118141 RepID=UPI001864D8DB|nr:interleukin-22 receptor subunit alpha-2 [Megalops cyprinoides]
MIPLIMMAIAFLMLQFSLVHCSEVLGIPDVITPQEVKFQSLDYINVLHWKPNGLLSIAPEYFVQYKIYGEKHWTNVTHCQGINQLLCDLSQETSDPREWYYARVQAALPGASSPWVLSSRFNPHWETSVSPPRMKLKVTKQGIVVQLRTPSSPFVKKKGSCGSRRKFQRLTYNIYVIHDNMVQEEHKLDNCVSELLIKYLSPNTTYCLQAEAHIQRLGRSSKKGEKSCITTL